MNPTNEHATAEPALYGRFLRGLALSPDGVAVRVGSESITYRHAHEMALRWGGALAGAKARAVGVLAGKGLTAYVGTLAALYAGATVVPLRPDFPAARTRQMLAASGARALVVDDSGLAALPRLLDDTSASAGPAELAVLAPGAAAGGGGPFPRLVAAPGEALDAPLPVTPDDAAYLLFTSGSTGRPKGVVITHGSTDHYFRLLDARYDFTPRDVFSQTFDLNFDCALFDMFCAWGAGATLQAVPPQAYRELPAFLAEREVTVWFSTPSAIALVRRMDGLAAAAMPGLRWSFFAGEALTCRDAADWRRAAPASTLENLYGPTELTITVAAYRWCDETTPGLAVNGVVPIGALHEGHDHFLLDDGDGGGPAGADAGGEGELCVAGPQLTPGYLDPDDGLHRFLERDSRRFYRTGDRVRRIGPGEFAYLGRLDTQVQVQGWRVELAEVEQALRTCGVDDAVVVGVQAAATELFAFYTGTPVAPVAITRRLRQILPDGVIPKHYRNVAEFPLNANRKVDRSALAARARDLLAAEAPGAE
ncbi:AMP-binding protein [Phytohabitans kaempferiae]|uniref:AMP-binding protein n=1 Tax=Phytohabitans kaempferiae TaxID=1620943 RepID=A0ABV6LYK8_9ACTN